jgi:hypothetical protein
MCNFEFRFVWFNYLSVDLNLGRIENFGLDLISNGFGSLIEFLDWACRILEMGLLG